ncbi:glutamate racemase [Sporosarcina sp. Marseille-Q4063]|uniref:glutamate racemase n=1 Tax=Sporosarcina sp. Marseille-Q4063 TaxID=2810514 RepID=UPI001BAEE269|nr:glutamate racemase [Sporosarcina sp. Marseille-Q4063]QUW22568.1 glutamate racemase [Sporosarcina sp. Marseille-Q4063]
MEGPIGIIDSGVGGLTVVKELRSRLPNESIIYIGDDKRCPYGPRPAEEVRQFTIEMASALSKMGIKMLVIACNTATAVALDDIRELFNFPVVGVIVPGARAAVTASTTGKIAVLGTLGTIKSGAYSMEIARQSPSATVFPLACPEFVPLVESGQYKSDHASTIVDRTLSNLAGKDFDAAILGCTHYPLLEDHIKKSLPAKVKVISSAVETVHDIERELIERNILNETNQSVEPIFYTTGLRTAFHDIVRDWLFIENPDVRHLTL